MKKRLLRFVAVLTVLLILTVNALAGTIPNPTENFFVNDFAGVISQSDAAKMQSEGEALYKKCGAQVVVAAVKSLDGRSIEDYSLEMARTWKIGDAEEDNGILLLLSVEERKVRIEVGYGLEGALPDSKTGRILDTYGISWFKANNFSKGLAAVYDSLVNEVYIEYGYEPDSKYEPVENNYLDSDLELLAYILLIIGFFIFLIIVSVLNATFRRKRKYYGGGNHFGGHYGGGGFSGGGGSFGGGGSSRGF